MSHVRNLPHPLTDEQHAALSAEAKHFYATCFCAHRANLPLATPPSKHVDPECAEMIAGLFGFSIPGKAPVQSSMFGEARPSALEAL